VVLRHLAQEPQHHHLFLQRFQHRADAEWKIHIGTGKVCCPGHDHAVLPAAVGQGFQSVRQGLGGLPLRGSNAGHHCGQRLCQLAQCRAAEGSQEMGSQRGDGVVAQVVPDVDDTLLHLAAVGDQHHQHLPWCKEDKFDVPDNCAVEVRILDDCHLVCQLGQQPDCAVQDVVEIVGVFQQDWMARRSAWDSGFTAEIWSTKSR
jgi:hypothetical protein